MTTNPYRILGVPDGASADECTAAYKRLAKKYHPDLNPNNPEAANKMAEINAAYDQIKNGNPFENKSYSRSSAYYYRTYTDSNYEEARTEYNYYPPQNSGCSGGCLGRLLKIILLIAFIQLVISFVTSFTGAYKRSRTAKKAPTNTYSETTTENRAEYFGNADDSDSIYY